MNHDLQNKIDEAEASLASQMEYINGMKDDRALSNYPSLPVHSYLWAFSEGAKFGRNDKQIQSLKAKIEELEGLKSLKTIRNQERAIQSLKDDYEKLVQIYHEQIQQTQLLQTIRESQGELIMQKHKEIQSLKDENGRIREALGLFKKELTIGSDGTNLKCTCSRENCHSLWLSAGDIIYRVSYAHTEKFKALTQKAEE